MSTQKFGRTTFVVIGVALLVAAAVLTRNAWLPWLPGGAPAKQDAAHAEGDAHEHDEEHGHDHAGHSDEASIKLSSGALRNIGFQPVTIATSTFVKTLTVPAMVVERPGRSQISITAPLSGVVTKIVPIEGAALEPKSPMFEIRLTHEELVAAQSELIRTAENLDVVQREINRLSSLGEGVIAGKRILEQEYEKQKLEASIRAERQALLLHGLSDADVDGILRDRKLFQKIRVDAPEHAHESGACTEEHFFHVQKLPVKLGQQVEAGQVLCVLADHCELYVEGNAFEDDAAKLREAARKGWSVSAALLAGDRTVEEIQGLKLLYLADHVDPKSRAFRFYLRLPNQVVLDQTDSSGARFLDWRFKPGQRMELRIPVEEWQERIVLPVESVVQEGAETYVYQQNGEHFERVPVHVEFRDQKSVVIANDGAVFPGDVVAARGAYQMHLALKNKSGGGVDPHAGHNH